MASLISTAGLDTDKPEAGLGATTASIRANFVVILTALDQAASEITAIQAGYQPLDATLTAFAALAGAADRLPYFTGSDTFALATFTAFGRSLVDDADAAAGRATLGLGTMATEAASSYQPIDADLSAIAALTSAADKLPYASGPQTWALTGLSAFARTLLDDTDAATARATLGVTAGGPNFLDNADFQIWQRGTSFTGITNIPARTADRWFAFATAAASITVNQQANSTDPFQYVLRLQRPNSNAVADIAYVCQTLDTVQSYPLRGRTLKLGFWARCGANYSPTSSLLAVKVSTGTTGNESAGTFSAGPCTGFTGNAALLNTTVTLSTSWQWFTATLTAVGATALQLGIGFGCTFVGTAGAADYFEIKGVDLVDGDVSQTRTCTPAEQAARCLRYFIRYGADGLGGLYKNTALEGTSNQHVSFDFPTPMRAAPSGSTNLTDGSYNAGAPSSTQWAFSQAVTSGYATKTGTVTIGFSGAESRGSGQLVFSGATWSASPTVLTFGTTMYVDFSADL